MCMLADSFSMHLDNLHPLIDVLYNCSLKGLLRVLWEREGFFFNEIRIFMGFFIKLSQKMSQTWLSRI